MSLVKSKFLKNRPIMVITIYSRPRDKAPTHVKGWGDKKENWTHQEHCVVVDNLTTKMWASASLIIDILNGEVVKKRDNDPAVNDEEVLKHYLGKYAEDVKKALQIWIDRESQKEARNMTVPEQSGIAQA